MQGNDPAVLVADIHALTSLLDSTSTPTVIIGPLCPSGATPAIQEAFARANAELAEAYPDTYVNPARLLDIDRNGARFRRGRAHLIPEAYARLQTVVDNMLGAQRGGPQDLEAAVFWGQHDPFPQRYGIAPTPAPVDGEGSPRSQ